VTIEAGVLSLKITETGADAVLSKLGQIDAKARALGNATRNIVFNAPSATGVSGQLAVVGAQMQQVTRATANLGAATAATGAAAVQSRRAHADLGQAVAATGAAAVQSRRAHADLGQAVAGNALIFAKGARSKQNAARQAGILNGQLGSLIRSYLGFSAAVAVYDKVTGAADRQDTAQRKLAATARLTGQSLGTITALAQTAQTRFAISSSAAADLTQNFVKLASRSGNVAQTGQLMNAWMDLAAAQGLSLSDVLTGVNSTLMGQDEGLNRIGLQNPSNIWKAWADAAGTTVAKMTDQQKWQAIVNAVTAEGAKVQGEYARFLDTTAGKQQAFNAALEATAATFGRSIAPAREWAYEVGTSVLSVLRAFMSVDDTLSGLPQKFKLLGLMVTNPGGFAAEVMKLNSPSTFTRQGPPIAGMGSPKAKAPAAIDKEAAKKAQETIEKALGLDLDQIPLVDITAGGPRVEKPGLVGVDKDGKMKGVKDAGPIIDQQFDALGAKILERRRMLGQLLQGVGDTIGSALASGFQAAFTGGNFFAEIGKALLAGLGSMIVQLGSSLLTYGLLMAAGAPLLMLTPFAGQALSAPAAIAAGTGLIALGAGMGALGGGGGKGGGGGSGSGGASRPPEQDEFSVAFDPDKKLRRASGSAVQPSSRGLSNAPMPEGRPVVHIGTINSLSPDDAKWQRAVADTYNNARNRGLVRNG
jgi:hypothetical protein